MKMTSVAQVSLYTLLWISHAYADIIIQTTTGQLKGITTKEENVEAFLSIPFAEPPIGKLRLERPLPKKPWKGVYSAENLPPICMQYNTGTHYEPSLDIPISEDCLFLNLWVPNFKSKEPKAIMVFIHGGAFTVGSSNMKLYDGTNLARKGDVIVATVNYRLGAFGFLFIEDENANGNMGMFDLIMAFKWIKANAKAFGGDPDNIVLFGESAGSILIGAFMLSPLTQNLFRRAIMQSGAPAHPYSMYNNTLITQLSKKIVRLSGCSKDKTSFKDSVTCMKSLPAKTIADAEGQLRIAPFFLVPRTNGDFFPSEVSHQLKYGNFSSIVEVLIGVNEAEGAFLLSMAAPAYFKNGEANISSKRLALALLRNILSAVGVKKEGVVLSKYYVDRFGNGTSDSYLEAIVTSVGDYYINCGSYFHAEFMSLNKNPVYFYVMKNKPASTPLGSWAKMTHFDELQYVFGNPFFESFTPEEEEFSDKIIQRWVAFAKTGNPSIPGEVEWPRFYRDDIKYLELSKKDRVHSERPDDGRCEIWRKKFDTVITEDVLSRFKQPTDTKE